MDIPEDRRLSVTSATDIARSTKDATARIALAKEVVERGLGVNDTKHLLSATASVALAIPHVDAGFQSAPTTFFDKPLRMNGGVSEAPKKRGRKAKHADARYAFGSMLEEFLRSLNLHITNFDVARLYDESIKESELRHRDVTTIKLIVDNLRA